MSKDDDKGKKKNLPRVDFLHFKNNSPDAFYTEEECEQIRYCWGDDLFTSGIVFKTEEDLKKFDIARERAKEYEKMKREESGGQKNNNVWPKRTDYVRKRPAAKSLIKKKTPKLVDVTNNKEKKKEEAMKSDSKALKTAAHPKKNVVDMQYGNRKNNRVVTVPGGNSGDPEEEKKKEQKRGKWLEDEYYKMNALLKAANDSTDHPSINNTEDTVDINDVDRRNNQNNDGKSNKEEEVSNDVQDSSFCQLCWQNPCEWFNYSLDVLEKDRAYEPLHYGVMSTWAIRNAHSERRTELTHLCDRIRARGKLRSCICPTLPLAKLCRKSDQGVIPRPRKQLLGILPAQHV